jgi:hypothetical protein
MTTWTEVDLPLYSDPFYSYSVSLENITYSVEIRYYQRDGIWRMSLFLEDQTPIAQGIALVPEYPILQDYNIEGMSGFFWLYPIPSIKTEKYVEDPEHLDQYYTFKYIYNFVD